MRPVGDPTARPASRGRVYTSRAHRRRTRGHNRALLVRWAAGPGLFLTGLLVVAGLVDVAPLWGLAGVAITAVVLGFALAVGRR